MAQIWAWNANSVAYSICTCSRFGPSLVLMSDWSLLFLWSQFDGLKRLIEILFRHHEVVRVYVEALFFMLDRHPSSLMISFGVWTLSGSIGAWIPRITHCPLMESGRIVESSLFANVELLLLNWNRKHRSTCLMESLRWELTVFVNYSNTTVSILIIKHIELVM